MEPTGKIDYSKFLIEIYTYSGEKLKKASINQNNDFYSSGLVPGMEYNIVFSYDNIFLLCAAFKCDTEGKVVYFCPAHFVYNNEVSMLSAKAGADLSNKVKRSAAVNVPLTLWQKKLIANFFDSHHEATKTCINNVKHIKFKAGSDLASKVK
jgi:hypothetical protein